MQEKNIHEGRNVKRFREMLGLKQEAFAAELGVSQQAISQLEQKEALDKEMLEKIAKVLKVPAEAIKNFDEEAVINYINTFNDGSVNHGANFNYQCSFNPLEKMVELYEALLKSEREKIALLERMLEKK